jgi:radical SAM superfamily enzyme
MPKFNTIIFCDTPEQNTKTRNYGAHRIASHIRDHGYSCLVVDFSSAIDWKLYNEILDLTVGEETYMVGFSSTFMPMRIPGELPSTEVPGRARRPSDEDRFDDQSLYSKKLINEFGFGRGGPWLDRIKELNPKTKIVFGGSGIAFYMDMPQVDNFVHGLAENMLMDYLDSISGRSKKRLFNRVLDYDYKAQDPKWDFRSSKTTYTEYNFITSNETLSLEIGRGCRFKCTYCSYPLIGQKNMDDYLKFQEVLKEELMDNYTRWGTTQYYIMDDTFNDSTEKLLQVKEVLDSLPFKITFWCYLRLDLLAKHPEQIPLLKEMGINQTYFGIETFHPAASKAVGKGMSAEKRKAALDMCKEVWGDDVHIQSGFMVGLPHEPEESIAETAAYLRNPDCPIHEAWIFPLNMFNGKYEDPRSKWIYQSEFDKNFDKHGYYFDKAVSVIDHTRWRKTDNSGITSSEEATRIAGKWDTTVPKRKFTADFYKASLNHPVLSNRELTRSMSYKEYEDFINSLDLSQLYFETVMEQYFAPLLAKLKI